MVGPTASLAGYARGAARCSTPKPIPESTSPPSAPSWRGSGPGSPSWRRLVVARSGLVLEVLRCQAANGAAGISRISARARGPRRWQPPRARRYSVLPSVRSERAAVAPRRNASIILAGRCLLGALLCRAARLSQPDLLQQFAGRGRDRGCTSAPATWVGCRTASSTRRGGWHAAFTGSWGRWVVDRTSRISARLRDHRLSAPPVSSLRSAPLPVASLRARYRPHVLARAERSGFRG